MDGQPASSSPSRDSHVRVLIIEDNALIALDLETQMEDLGCDVVGVAVTAAQAIATARRTLPDLALVDLQLADGSRGQDAALVLRSELDVAHNPGEVARRHRGGTTCDPSWRCFRSRAPHELGDVVSRYQKTHRQTKGLCQPFPVIFMRSPATAVRRSLLFP